MNHRLQMVQLQPPLTLKMSQTTTPAMNDQLAAWLAAAWIPAMIINGGSLKYLPLSVLIRQFRSMMISLAVISQIITIFPMIYTKSTNVQFVTTKPHINIT